METSANSSNVIISAKFFESRIIVSAVAHRDYVLAFRLFEDSAAARRYCFWLRKKFNAFITQTSFQVLKTKEEIESGISDTQN